MSLMLSNAVALGLCRETLNEEVAAEQLALTVRALETRALKAEAELAAPEFEELKPKLYGKPNQQSQIRATARAGRTDRGAEQIPKSKCC